MRKRSLVTIVFGTLAALAVIAPVGEGSRAMAAQVGAEHEATAGRLIYQTEERDCRPAGDSLVCGFDIKWIGLNDRGEVVTLTVFGSFLDRSEVAGLDSPSEGHGIWRYPDGSTQVVRSEATVTFDETGQRVVAGTHSCVDGTGRFADVDCTIEWSHSAQPNEPASGSFNGTVTPRTPS